jgi:predicted aldo/keto reductase-like oxidoreductase
MCESVDKIIDTPELFKKFKSFCIERYCEENLFFLVDVKNFKKIENNHLEKAMKICNLYLRTNSFCEICVSKNKIKKVFTKLKKEKVQKNLFDEIAFEVTCSIETQRLEFIQEIKVTKFKRKSKIFPRVSNCGFFFHEKIQKICKLLSP